MPLCDVYYQPRAQKALQRALRGERMAHAYIFHGPEGVGKESLARGLGQLLLCGNPSQRELPAEMSRMIGVSEMRDACGACEDCRWVASGAHPDFHLIERRLHREHPDPEVRRRKGLELGVDVIRHFVVNRVGYTPVRGRAKVFVICEADEMSTAAQNALLKTLEEPPTTTFLVLLTGSPDQLLSTTRSRCQSVEFQGLPASFLEQRLQALHGDWPAEQRAWYVRGAAGRLGAMLADVEDGRFALHQRISRMLDGLKESNFDDVLKEWTEESKRLGEVESERDPDLSDSESTRRALRVILRLSAEWCAERMRRDVLSPDAGDLRRGATSAIRAIQRIAEAERQLDANANAQLCLSALLADLADRLAA